MIPKTIHYCWFGNSPMPELAEKCIASWKKFLPDYTIIRWDETNYDITEIPYVHEAYQAKRWAFVSDYVRFDVLYKYGGIYFDTDVEVIASMDDMLDNGPFMGLQRTVLSSGDKSVFWPNPGLGIAAEAGMEIYRELLQLYNGMRFVLEDGKLNLNTVPMFTYQVMEKHGFDQFCNELQNVVGITVWPVEYLSPIDYFSGEIKITRNTRSIHHFAASWLTETEKKLAVLDRMSRNKGRIIGSIIYCVTLPVRFFYKLKTFGVKATGRSILLKISGRG